MKATSDWLGMHARFRPDAEALVDVSHQRRWTYAALQYEALGWAGRLRSLGVGRGDRVAVLSQNRGETFALLFACAELGAVLFPMNWRLSPAELGWQFEHAQPAAVLVEEGLRPLLAAAPARYVGVSIEEGPGAPTRGPGAALDAPWVLMYTSGSTGKPKGALLSHGQLHWNAVNTTLACDLTPADSTLTFTPLFHTGGLNCLSTPLLHRGGRVVLCRSVEPASAFAVIESERVTLLMGVPTIYQMLADHPGFAEANLRSVRDALCGGQALSAALLDRWLARGVPLRQGFGMTEVGPNCFSMPPARVKEKLGSVGLPIHHVGMRLVRDDGLDCDVGEPGELLLSGPATFLGYFNDAASTSAAIVDGWFHTGDVLTRDSEGFYWVSGRKKEMYKSGGENVYPAEVEAAIAGCPGVALVGVVGVPDERWGEVGRAFIELEPGASLSASDVLAWLDGRIARFKLPKQVWFGDLPRTASGKIDKVALRSAT